MKKGTEVKRSYTYMITSKYLLEETKTLEEIAERLEGWALKFREMSKTGKIKIAGPVNSGIGHLVTFDKDVAEKFRFEVDDE